MCKRGYKLGDSRIGLYGKKRMQAMWCWDGPMEKKEDISYRWNWDGPIGNRGCKLGDTGMGLLEKEDAIGNIGKLFLAKCNHPNKLFLDTSG